MTASHLPADDVDRQVYPDAWIAGFDLSDLDGWAPRMRLVIRQERPHPWPEFRESVTYHLGGRG